MNYTEQFTEREITCACANRLRLCRVSSIDEAVTEALFKLVRFCFKKRIAVATVTPVVYTTPAFSRPFVNVLV